MGGITKHKMKTNRKVKMIVMISPRVSVHTDIQT